MKDMSNDIRTIDVSQLSEAVNIMNSFSESHRENEYPLENERSDSINDQQIIVLDNNFLKLMEESTQGKNISSDDLGSSNGFINTDSSHDAEVFSKKEKRGKTDKPLPVTLLVPAKNNRKNYFHGSIF